MADIDSLCGLKIRERCTVDGFGWESLGWDHHSCELCKGTKIVTRELSYKEVVEIVKDIADAWAVAAKQPENKGVQSDLFTGTKLRNCRDLEARLARLMRYQAETEARGLY